MPDQLEPKKQNLKGVSRKAAKSAKELLSQYLFLFKTTSKTWFKIFLASFAPSREISSFVFVLTALSIAITQNIFVFA